MGPHLIDLQPMSLVFLDLSCEGWLVASGKTHRMHPYGCGEVMVAQGVNRTAMWCGCAVACLVTVSAILKIGLGGVAPVSPAPMGAGSDNQGATSGEQPPQSPESARNDSRFVPGSGRHDFEAQTAVQTAVTNNLSAGTDWSSDVRFIGPSDAACWSGQGPSHEFFVYKKDGAISTGVVCEDAKEDWYVTHLRLLKEGTGERYPGA